MGQLRAKLEADSADPQHLLTEPGVGYRLAEPDAID
jgi:two-component system KDP operon response regulator KdpE